MSKVPSSNFMATIAANIDNDKLSDKDFREFVRNTLPIVEFPRRCKLLGMCANDAYDDVNGVASCPACAAKFAKMELADKHNKDIIDILADGVESGSVKIGMM